VRRQIGEIDRDIEQYLKQHFAEQRKLLEGIKGVDIGTQARLLAALPELGKLNEAFEHLFDRVCRQSWFENTLLKVRRKFVSFGQ
jgi:hypothetical protein